MRVGLGLDAHRFSPSGVVRLGGVVVDESRGVDATSDGDVLAHALCDALLGAAALGDLGEHYPSDSAQWVDADSMVLLTSVVERLRGVGLTPVSVDATVIAERVRVSTHRVAIRKSVAAVLGMSVDFVSVKATTTDGLGMLGRDEGIAAMAVVLVTSD